MTTEKTASDNSLLRAHLCRESTILHAARPSQPFYLFFLLFFLLTLLLFFFNHGTGLAGKVINMLRGSAGWSRTRELSKSHAQLFKAGLLEINIIVVNYNSNLWEVEHESRGLSHPQLYIMSFKLAEALRDLDSKHKNKNRYPLKIQNKLFLFASKK